MKYLSGILLLLLMFSVIACGAAPATETAADTPQPEAVAQATEPVEPTATQPMEPTATQAEPAVEESVSDTGAAECRVEPITDLINIPSFPELAVISDADWQHGGSKDSSVTVIEFGDFQ